ncbi:thiamine phosphate synthase [Rosettibacter firmus]|uniref:thiamine phosphate synthase n=1 Tax=Rosettibacter firmus TaxID=3111522 RepID=UPI00336BFCC4
MERIKGLYAITDENLIPDDKLEEMIEQAILGGVNLVQLRDKYFGFEKRLERAKRIKSITDKYKIPLIINDDPYVALESNADGVHLGKEDLGNNEFDSFNKIRKILKNKIIGISCYDDLERAIMFEKLGADYVAFGAVFASPTKPSEPVLNSIDFFKKAKKKLKIPVVAIGGINENNYKLIIDYVDAIAVVSALFNGNPYINAKKFCLE